MSPCDYSRNVPFSVPPGGGTRIGENEVERKRTESVEVMARVKAGSLRLTEAAEPLELSYRQVKRVWARYRVGRARALQHRNCGRQSNRASIQHRACFTLDVGCTLV